MVLSFLKTQIDILMASEDRIHDRASKVSIKISFCIKRLDDATNKSLINHGK